MATTTASTFATRPFRTSDFGFTAQSRSAEFSVRACVHGPAWLHLVWV